MPGKNGLNDARKNNLLVRVFTNQIVKKKALEKLEDWEKVSIIPRGGTYRSRSGQTIGILNSCTVDPFLQIMYMFYGLNVHQMERLFESENLIAHKVREVVQLLLTDAFVDAKYF